MQSTLLPLLAVLLLSACASTAPTAAPEPTMASINKDSYPVWLEMKPGYAEACISAGGCVPMTQAELNEMAAAVMLRTLQACRRMPSI